MGQFCPRKLVHNFETIFVIALLLYSYSTFATDKNTPQIEKNAQMSSILPKGIVPYCPGIIKRIIEKTYLTAVISTGRALKETDVTTKRAFKKQMNQELLTDEEIFAVHRQGFTNRFPELNSYPKWIQKFNYGMSLWYGSMPGKPSVSPFVHLFRLLSEPYEYYQTLRKRRVERIYSNLLSDRSHFELSEKEKRLLTKKGLLSDFEIFRTNLEASPALRKLKRSTFDMAVEDAADLAKFGQQMVDRAITIPVSIFSWFLPITNPLITLKSRLVYKKLMKHALEHDEVLEPQSKTRFRGLSIFSDKRHLAKYGLDEDYYRFGNEFLAHKELYKKIVGRAYTHIFSKMGWLNWCGGLSLFCWLSNSSEKQFQSRCG